MSVPRRWLPTVLLVTLLGAAGCAAGGSAPDGAASPVASGTARVEIRNGRFEPAELRVPVGTTVVWVNRDSTVHTVTSGTRVRPSGGPTPGRPQTAFTGLFDQSLPPNAVTSYTFTHPGRYHVIDTMTDGAESDVIVG